MHGHKEAILEGGLRQLEAMLNQTGLHGRYRPGQDALDVDGVFDLEHEEATLYLKVQDSLHPYQIKQMVERYSQWLQRKDGTHQDILLVLVRDCTRSALDLCAESGLCVLTEDGNGYISFPRFLYHRFVPSKSRRRTSSGPGAIFSAKASRLVRAVLTHYPEPWAQSALVEATHVSPGYVSSMIKKMIDADYVRREHDRLRVVDADRLLNDWAARYRFDRHIRTRYAMSIGEHGQGLRKFQQEMRRQDIRYALTGWSAAYLRAPFGTPDSIVAYVERPIASPTLRALREVESKGNVLVLVPHDNGVFQFGNDTEFGPVVSDVQCYLDLLNLPGRASEQAEVLREKQLAFKEMMNDR